MIIIVPTAPIPLHGWKRILKSGTLVEKVKEMHIGVRNVLTGVNTGDFGDQQENLIELLEER